MRETVPVSAIHFSHGAVRRNGPGLAPALAAGGLCAAWALGVPQLQDYALRHQPGLALQVSLIDPPAWADADLRASLIQAAGRRIGPDHFRRDELVAAREALLETGWFQDVDQVRRVDARRVEIRARFAEPAAVVADTEGRQHVVDAAGRLLPRSYPAGQPTGMIAITGASFGPPQRPGLRWPGEDVDAALALLSLVRDRSWAAQVDHIDVARHVRDGTLRMITDRGCTIIWGRKPGEEAGAEVPAAQKLGYLDYHAEHYGHIDRGLLELDITGDVVVGR